MDRLYLRLSTTEEKQKTSFEVQEKAIIEKFKLKDYVVYKETVSGAAKLDKRQELANLLQDLKKGDRVYIYALDRLSRDTAFCGWLRVEIQAKGAELFSVRENLKDDAQGKLIASILASIAEHERELIKSRITAALQLKKQNGEKLGGNVKYGYKVEERNGKKYLVENPEEMHNIRAILEVYKKKKNYNQTSKELAKRGIFGRDGKPLSRALIKNIVKRRR